MAQPKIEGVGHGVPRMLYASDGSNWYAILVDSDGHVKIDVVSAALPTDAATETTLALIKGYVDNLETLLAGGLPAALDSGALKTKEQSPLTGLATAANQTIIAGYIDTLETLLSGGLPTALDSGALKVKEQSPLTGFATSTNQATMITSLQLIDDLRAALGSVNTDDLQVDVKTYPGSNALGNFPFGYNDRVTEYYTGNTSAGGAIDKSFTAVAAGEVLVVQAIWVANNGAAGSWFALTIRDGTYNHLVKIEINVAQYIPTVFVGQLVLKAGDLVKIVVSNGGATKVCEMGYWGYKMKVA